MLPDALLTHPPFAESLVARLTDVAAGWLLTYLLHSTLILLAAWIVTSRARMSDAVRDIVWKCALVGGLVTASLQMGIAREPLGGQLQLASLTGSAAPSMRVSVDGDVSGQRARVFVTRPTGTRWTAGLLVLWLTGSGAGLLWLTFGHARTLRVLGDRMPLDGAPIADRLRALLVRSRVSRPVALTCSATIASPVALAGDEVCLPRRALFELEPNEQDGMLAHEVAHLVRRDPQWLITARAIETVLFMQPLNRVARHRMQEVAEYLCDDWAVSRMSQPVTLAKCLAAVAEWVGRAPRAHTPRLHPLSAMVESGGSPLVRRVGRILTARSAPRARSARIAFGASAGALVALVCIAPRVSVANAAVSDRAATFIRAITASDSAALGRDTPIVFRTGVRRIAIDSLVARTSGRSAGAVVSRGSVVYRTYTVDAGDSVPPTTNGVWVRRVAAPAAGAAAGGRRTPMVGGQRANMILIEGRNER